MENKKQYRGTLRALKKDKIYDSKSEYATAAEVLMAATIVGTDPKAISKLTGHSLKKIKPYIKNYKEGGIFRGKKVAHSGWFDKESGGVALSCDILVGKGYLQRVKNKVK